MKEAPPTSLVTQIMRLPHAQENIFVLLLHYIHIKRSLQTSKGYAINLVAPYHKELKFCLP